MQAFSVIQSYALNWSYTIGDKSVFQTAQRLPLFYKRCVCLAQYADFTRYIMCTSQVS